MNITYITGLYNIFNNGYSKILEENFNKLLQQNIKLIVYVDQYFYDILPKRDNIIKLELQELKTYSLIINKNPKLPKERNIQDTLEYMALINSKIEIVHRSLNLIDTEYVAWIDAGIFKIFKNEINLSTIEIYNLNKVLIPGGYQKNLSFENLTNNVWWNYMGGFFVSNKHMIENFYNLSLNSINYFLENDYIAWEVNIWANIKENIFEWYHSSHNDSIINIPIKFAKLGVLKEKAIKLRAEGKYEECYKIAREVLEIEKNPFSTTNEDISIVSYYLNKKEEGRIANERILMSNFSNLTKNQAMANLFFYIKPLDILKFYNIDYTLPENYFPSSPSIIPYKNGYLYNIRAVNYTIEENGGYRIHDPKSIVKTKNFILKLDKDFNIISQFQLSDDLSILSPRFHSNILGLEDIRLFTDGKDNYFFATCCEVMVEFCPRIVFGSYDDFGNLLFIKALKIPGSDNNTCEKNWLPFVTDDNKIRFIYSYSPLKIYEIDKDTFNVTLVHTHEENKFKDYEFRGSSPPIRYLDGWLLTIHQVLYSTPRKYYHRLVWYNNNFTERKYGPLFYFEKIGIEYNLSICIHGDELLFTYSINDSCQKMCSISLETLNEQLKFSDYLLKNYIYNCDDNDENEKKICLCMIVKNESKIIERCMSSCLPVLNYISICDTGSTDNTVEIIENFCKKNNIEGKVHHQEWKNFGHNRTLSYETAKKTFPDADYCLLIDADMILKISPEFNKSSLFAGSYMVAQQGGSLYYFNTRLLGTKYNWKCIGVTHEYWSPEDPNCVNKQLTTLTMPDLGDGGSKSDKFERDIKLLTQGIIDEPNNERYMFYLAQSYHDIGKYKDAIHWYTKRIRKAGWYEEVYYSYYRIARCYLGLGRSWEMVEQSYEEAWKYLPSRMEPLYEIGKHYQETEQYEKAYKWLKKACVIPFPKEQVLFLLKDIYEYAVWDALGISAFYVGEYKESVDACIKALKSEFCLGNAERIKNNMRYSINKMKEIKEMKEINTIPRILWLFWDKGVEKMPELIKEIYNHNVTICKKYNWEVILITLENVKKHFPNIQEKFFQMTPYDQSDYVRFQALKNYGGIWLDTDFIVTGNLDKLFEIMKEEENFLAFREYEGGCIGSAILVSKKESNIAKFCYDEVEKKVEEVEKFTEWGVIGPPILKLISSENKEFKVIDGITAENSVNFANWRLNPGNNIIHWYKNNEEDAENSAKQIESYGFSIVGTWTIYRNHDPKISSNLSNMIFKDNKSVFYHLIK